MSTRAKTRFWKRGMGRTPFLARHRQAVYSFIHGAATQERARLQGPCTCHSHKCGLFTNEIPEGRGEGWHVQNIVASLGSNTPSRAVRAGQGARRMKFGRRAEAQMSCLSSRPRTPLVLWRRRPMRNEVASPSRLVVPLDTLEMSTGLKPPLHETSEVDGRVTGTWTKRIASRCQQLWWQSESQSLTRRSIRRWAQVRMAVSSEGLRYSHVSAGGRLAVPDDTGVMPSGLGSRLGDSLSQGLRNAAASPTLGM